MSRLGRLRALRVHDIACAVEALGAVAEARAYIAANRYARLRKRLARMRVGPDPAPREVLRDVQRWVRHAARVVPGATCLTQASAGQLLLARRGYASTVRLSVAERAGASEAFGAHAWLLADETIILGGTSDDYAAHRMLHDFALPAAPEGVGHTPGRTG